MRTLGINQAGHDLTETFTKKQLHAMATVSLLSLSDAEGGSSPAPASPLLWGTTGTRSAIDVIIFVNCTGHS